MKLFLVLSLAVFLASCSITLPVSATGPVDAPKTGTASATVVLGMCFGGDASVQKAAQAGGIVEVATVDLRTRNYLAIVQVHSCIVRGK